MTLLTINVTNTHDTMDLVINNITTNSDQLVYGLVENKPLPIILQPKSHFVLYMYLVPEETGEMQFIIFLDISKRRTLLYLVRAEGFQNPFLLKPVARDDLFVGDGQAFEINMRNPFDHTIKLNQIFVDEPFLELLWPTINQRFERH